MAKMVRVNSRFSASLNQWLDDYSESTGLPKSNIIMIAVEQYRLQVESMTKINELNELKSFLESQQVEGLKGEE